MPRLVGKQSSSVPTILVLSFLVLSGGLIYYLRETNPQWFDREFRNILPSNSSQNEIIVPES